ncbi:MAG: acyl-CoA dehydrogenase family protein, partial [Planctomycetes bacterium]|nr:acyl-CoA dehydrogenase family protein [Planctomycetota bacterium]
MEYSLTPEQEELKDAVIKFAQAELNDNMVERDRAGEFSHEGWKKCAEFGIHGMPISEEFGGGGLDLTTTIAVMEGLGYGCKDQGLIFSINAHMWTNSIPLQIFGTPEQKAKYLPGLCNGDLIGANGVSEPESGSDVFGMATTAIKDGDDYILNGTKTFCTNAQVADLVMTYATLNPEYGLMGITAFLIEKDMPGFSISKKIEKMGLRTSPMAELIFEDCRVPAANVLGRPGRGAEVFNCSMEWERSCILASCLGTMQRQLEQCIRYAQTRKQYGKAIGKFQSVANRIVDMKVRIETARPLIYKIGWLKDQG